MEKSSNWYAARTRFGQELKVKERLASMGVEHFIPTTVVHEVKCGRKKKTVKPIINNLVFLRADKELALNLVNLFGLPVHYLIDWTDPKHSILIVPDKQMLDFIKVMEYSDGSAELLEQNIAVGDRVRVTSGKLLDVEGNVLEASDGEYIVVSLCGMLQAKARIPAGCLKKI